MPRFLLVIALIAAIWAVGFPGSAGLGQAVTSTPPLPVKRWWGTSTPMFLLVPAAATQSTSDAPLGVLMQPGWRVIWDGTRTTPGHIVARFSTDTVPSSGVGRETEVLQIGVSDEAAAVQTCSSYGLKDPSVHQEKDRVIQGQVFAAWSGRRAGMNQVMDVTDLRAAVKGICYAVERFSYSTEATTRDPAVVTPDAVGARALDDAVATLRLGKVRAGNVLMPAH